MKFYVGDYTSLGGPGVCECELKNDELRLVQTADVRIIDPSYLILSADRRTLFAVTGSESDGEKGDSVASFDLTDGGLRLTSMRSTAGSSACHLTLSPDERFLYAACYNSGSLAVFPVEGGRIGPRVQRIQHEGHGPNASRQAGPHTHFVQFHPGDGRLYAVDLGMDAVMIYRQDPETGLLAADERVNVPEGMGPRHLAFQDDMMYVAHELGGAVSVFRSTAGGWTLEQTISTLLEGCGSEGAVAAIRVLRDRLYVSNRQNDCIAEFEIRRGGSLSLERTFSVFGSFPRDFVLLDEGLLLVANQNSGDVRLIEAPPLGKPPLRKLYLRGTRPIVGGQYTDAAFNEVCQIGEALSIPGAVCVCPAAE